MEDGFDVVTVWIEHEGAVVVRMVVRATARSSIIHTAGRQRGVVEGIDGFGA